MDPISQGVLGASFAGVLSNSKKLRLASLCGCIGGLAPDLDVIIKSNSDPLLSLEFHRHFTHSIFFVPIGGLITCLLIYFFIPCRPNPFYLHRCKSCSLNCFFLFNPYIDFSIRRSINNPLRIL